MKSVQQYSFIKALRPFSLSVAIIAGGLGCLIAWQEGFHHHELVILIILAGLLAQIGINLINDIEDISLIPNHHPNASTIKMMINRHVKIGIGCFIVASIIALYLITLQGWPLFVLIVLSAITALNYNIGFNFKHRGLAIIQVFILMGILMVQGAYLAMTGHFSANVVLHSIPISLLISLLLLSNELRDWKADKYNGIHTLTVRIGYQKSSYLYWSLIIISYLIVISFFYTERLPSLTWFLLPLPLLIFINAYLNTNNGIALTPMTGRFFFLFGIAYMLTLYFA